MAPCNSSLFRLDVGSSMGGLRKERQRRNQGERVYPHPPGLTAYLGDAYDSVMCYSFFATLECKLIGRSRLHTPTEAETALFGLIEDWYNSRRRHSALDMMSPMEHESRHLGVTQDTSPDLSTETG
jgi:hypothetical protein